MKLTFTFARGLVAGGALAAIAAAPATAATLDDVLSKDFVQCGVSQGLPGFSNPNDAGDWTGMDADFCRAVAAAVLGDASKVKFTPFSAKERFTALSSGEIDLLARNTTWTMGRDTTLGVNFAGVNYYDGQGLMMREGLFNELTADGEELSLDGSTVCTNTGTTTELNITDYFRTKGWEFELVAFEKADEVVDAYDKERCDIYTTDRSALAGQRLKLTEPGIHIILPDTLSKEPLGPVVRQGDDQWFNIIKWTHYAMVNAEELGVTSENIEEMKASENPAILRLLGVGSTFGENIGVGNDWAANIIAQVGNYGEVYDRNVGPDTPLQLARGVNALWTEGGLQYAPPIR
ncbi:MAG: amino acid ABC transporter substrate-binding protein [Pseudomonadota bacterium]